MTAQHVTLKQTLHYLENQLHLIIHAPVSLSIINNQCIAPDVVALLHCIVENSSSTVLRYANAHQIRELWIVPQAHSTISPQDRSTQPSISHLLSLIRSPKMQQRRDSVIELARIGSKESQSVIDNALQDVLKYDKDDAVRAQALKALTLRKTMPLNDIIVQALLDSSVSVRLSALEASNDLGLLKQASLDNDKTVSAYATMRLKSLTQ